MTQPSYSMNYHIPEEEDIPSVREPAWRRLWDRVRAAISSTARPMTALESRLLAEKNALADSLRVAKIDLETAQGNILIAERHEERLQEVIESLRAHVNALTAIKAQELAMTEAMRRDLAAGRQPQGGY